MEHRRFGLLAILIVIATTGVVSSAFWSFDNDDAYITYRYARNMAAGKGPVYNEGERVLGTTTPLFAILIGSFSFLYNNPVFWGKLFSSLFLGLFGFEIIYILFRNRHPEQTPGTDTRNRLQISGLCFLLRLRF